MHTASHPYTVQHVCVCAVGCPTRCSRDLPDVGVEAEELSGLRRATAACGRDTEFRAYGYARRCDCSTESERQVARMLVNETGTEEAKTIQSAHQRRIDSEGVGRPCNESDLMCTRVTRHGARGEGRLRLREVGIRYFFVFLLTNHS